MYQLALNKREVYQKKKKRRKNIILEVVLVPLLRVKEEGEKRNIEKSIKNTIIAEADLALIVNIDIEVLLQVEKNIKKKVEVKKKY